MSQAPHPRMHGLTHVQGGSDPVPGLLAAPGGPIDYQIPGVTLEYWYRLGETGPWPTSAMTTPDFALDSSGNTRHLAAYNRDAAGTAVVFPAGDVALPDCHIAGGLAADNDDGAIQFNWNQFQWSAWGEKVALIATHSIGIEVAFRDGTAAVGAGSTFAAWVAYMQPSGPGRDNMAPWNPDGTYGDGSNPANNIGLRPLISTWERTFGIGNYGAKLGFTPADGHLWYIVGSLNTPAPAPFVFQTDLGLAPGAWTHFVSAVEKLGTDSYQRRIFLNGNKLVDLTGTLVEIGGGAAPGYALSIGGGYDDDLRWAHGRGKVDEVAYWNAALTDAQISGIYQSGTGSTAGLVLGIDDTGHVAWVQPKVEVTVNGEPPTSTPGTNPASPVQPADPNSAFPGTDDWIVDEAFTWNGSTFTVPPNKWTTIPFTDPLMGRWSNITPRGTWLTELAWNDPAAAGWINPATPRAITVPHDMPFMDLVADPYVWMQICLRIESPLVEPETSYRALRVFETTHQKTLVSANGLRAVCCESHGAVDVFRDQDVPGWTGDSTIFASGDTGGFDNGNHDRVMFMPNYELAFPMPGLEWLPVVAGKRTLKKGMRLVPQVWHDASVPLTFTCAPAAGTLYRPHFVVWQTCDRGWGSPWSDWPLYP